MRTERARGSRWRSRSRKTSRSPRSGASGPRASWSADGKTGHGPMDRPARDPMRGPRAAGRRSLRGKPAEDRPRAAALHDVDVLLLDEPTRGIDVGSKAQIYELIDRLALAGKAMLIVSSQLPELVGICDRIAVMRRGELGDARPARDTPNTRCFWRRPAHDLRRGGRTERRHSSQRWIRFPRASARSLTLRLVARAPCRPRRGLPALRRAEPRHLCAAREPSHDGPADGCRRHRRVGDDAGDHPRGNRPLGGIRGRPHDGGRGVALQVGGWSPGWRRSRASPSPQ